jgi:hypothetical protein
MKPLFVELSETVACYSCDSPVPTRDTEVCPSCGAASFTLPFPAFFAMLERGEVIHARAGGLVVGRTCSEDDIPLLRYVHSGHFQCIAYMQGGEYLVGAEASVRHYGRLCEINNEKGDWLPPSSVPLTAATTVINTNHVKPTACLWIHSGQFVVNRYATAKHLEELERLNSHRG